MKILTIILTLFILVDVSAQALYDNTWILGTRDIYPSGDTIDQNEPWGNLILRFNPEPNLERLITRTSWDNVNTIMSDSEGELLFYSNGCYLQDATHEIIDNSDSIQTYHDYEYACIVENYGNTESKSMVSLPAPNSSTNFYIISMVTSRLEEPDPNGFPYGTSPLTYAVFDAEMNNGLGGLVSKRNIMNEYINAASSLGAVKHQNGRDWWVFTRRLEADIFDKHLIDSVGVHYKGSQGIGDSIFNPYKTAHTLFDPQGQWLVTVIQPFLYFYDIDRSTGELSNARRYRVQEDTVTMDAAFSPSGRFIYVSQVDKIFQFDTEAEDFEASRVLVGEYDGTFIGSWAQRFNFMQLAPDCRIYISTFGGGRVYHVIQYPDRAGLECGFLQGNEAVKFPVINNGSISNFPHYRLGTPYPTCDSTIAIPTALREFFAPEATKPLEVFPNPTQGELTVALPTLLTGNDDVILEVVDLLGTVVWKQPRQTAFQTFNNSAAQLNLSGYAAGIYFVRLTSASGKRWLARVVLQ